MHFNQVTPLVLTFNEEANIANCLGSLSWARRIVVLDSGSTDQTQEIAKRYGNVEFFSRPFDNHSNQWNFGLDLIESEWVLTLDADYICPEAISEELMRLDDDMCPYLARFQYCVFGKPLRATLYPPRVVLFPTRAFRYFQDGHTQLLDTKHHQPRFLQTVLMHNDLKPLNRWVESQSKYAFLESRKLSSSSGLSWKDRIRNSMLFAPILTLLYCLFYKRLVFDGIHGMNYAFQRTYAELLLSLYLLDARLRDRKSTGRSELPLSSRIID